MKTIYALVLAAVVIGGSLTAAWAVDAGSTPDTPAAATGAAPDTPPDGAAPPPAGDTAQDSAADDPMGTFGEMIEAVRSGHWRMAAALALSLVMLGFNWARKNWPPLESKLRSDRAGALSLIGIAVAGGLLTALASDATLDAKLLIGSVWTAVDAAGIFLLVKKIFFGKKAVPAPSV